MNWIHQTVKKKWAPKNFKAKSLTLKFCDLDPKVMVIGPDVADKNLKAISITIPNSSKGNQVII